MGKTFDAMRGRNFNASKFNALLNLAVSRLAVLRNQRGARYNLAQSDVVHILKLGHHERALLRVEQVIKEQNMLDVYVMMEGYCHLMAERINLIEHERECPEELKEALSSMLYASTRCGDFPELQEMRAVFTSRYGKEFVARATELRNNCGVNPKMLQKLSTRQPSLENRLKVLKDIASEKNIVLQIEENSSISVEVKLETEQRQQRPKAESPSIPGMSTSGDNLQYRPEEMGEMESFSDPMKAPRKYKDVADAAQAAFKSAAYAAAAARAAVELSKSEAHGPSDHSGSGSGKRKAGDEHCGIDAELQITEENNSTRMEDWDVGVGFEKVDDIGNSYSESEDEEIRGEKRVEDSKIRMPGFNSDSDEDFSKGSRTHMDVVREKRPVEDKEIYSDMMKPGSPMNEEVVVSDKYDTVMNEEVLVSKKSDTVVVEDVSERNGAKADQSENKVRVGFRAGLKARLRAWKS